MKILVTGFEPFGGEQSNPSTAVVELLPDRIADCEIIKLILPVVRGKASAKVKGAVEKHKPDVILSIGQAGGRAAVSVEKVAVNLDDYRIADNEGNQPLDEPVIPEGPDGYFATIPVRKIVDELQNAGIPAVQSLSAGTFVCNHVMYSAGHMCAEKMGKTKFGFIHIPYLPEQAAGKPGQPSMNLKLSARAVRIAIEVILRENDR